MSIRDPDPDRVLSCMRPPFERTELSPLQLDRTTGVPAPRRPLDADDLEAPWWQRRHYDRTYEPLFVGLVRHGGSEPRISPWRAKAAHRGLLKAEAWRLAGGAAA